MFMAFNEMLFSRKKYFENKEKYSITARLYNIEPFNNLKKISKTTKTEEYFSLY
jgi:hypothetical protein